MITRRCLAIGLVALALPCAASAIERIATIDMPGVRGRIDHLAADPVHHRVFVAALGNDTVEVVDTATAAVRTIRGLREPQGILYVPDLDRVVVANAGGGVDVVDAGSLAVVARIDGVDDADNVRYEAQARFAWVGFGRGGLRALDPSSGDRRGRDIALPGHPESFELERGGNRLFVNVPSAHAVVVVDRLARHAVARWETPGTRDNYPMAFDEADARLFVGARSPPTLLVYDAETGNVVARLPVGRDADDVFFDARRKRVYVICGEGRLDVIRQAAPNRYAAEASIATASGARTGLFVADENRLYVAAPAAGRSPARLLVYRVD